VLVTAAVGHEPLGLRASGDERRLRRLERAYEATAGQSTPTRLDVLRALVLEERLAFGAPRTVDAPLELATLADELGLGVDPLSRARVALLEAREVGDAPVPCGERLAAAERAYELTSAAGDTVLRLEAAELVLTGAMAASDLDRCEEARWELAREGGQANRPRSTWVAKIAEASLLLAAGRTDEAEAAAAAALELGGRLGIADAFAAYGAHTVVKGLLAGDIGPLAPLLEQAIESYPHLAGWRAAAAISHVDAGNRTAAEEHLADYLTCRAGQTSREVDRAGLGMAARAAASLGNTTVAALVRTSLPADPDAVLVVGVGAGILGPVNLYVALADLTLDDTDAAHRHAAEAEALASRLGWAPWATAARQFHHLRRVDS
jgi:hypothetical protein